MPAADFTVFLIDDDPCVLRVLKRHFQSAGYKIKTYSSCEAFLDEHDASMPGCVVLNLSMPDLNGLAVQQALTRQGADRPVIFFAGHVTIEAAILAMKGGAIDVLLKPVNRSKLLQTIKCAEERDKINRRVDAERQTIHELLEELTPREREVLAYVIAGNLNKQIAAALGTVEKTIKVHRSRIMTKMEVRSVAQLVRMTEKISLQPYQIVN
jgi:RNA polymerase sigma factor (sigma-70 family)